MSWSLTDRLPDRGQHGNYLETGFWEIGARAVLLSTAFPPIGLGARFIGLYLTMSGNA
jgi:hypothetical protein